MQNRLNTCIILLGFLLLTSLVEAQHDKYHFTTLTGRAVLSRTSGSTWLALQSAQPVELKPGDMVNVEGDGRGELRFPDGTIVRIKNNAMVTLMRYGINLRLGYAWLNVRRSSDIFKVVTPLGSCSVLGTSFDVDVDRYGKSKVRVFSGLVAVRAADDSRNRQLVLQPNMQTTLSDKTKVADKPGKFQGTTLETSLKSEWERRNFADAAPAPMLQPAIEPDLPPALQPAAAAPVTRDDKVLSPQQRPVQPPPPGPAGIAPALNEEGLPPIRPELDAKVDLPAAAEVIGGIRPQKGSDGKISIARQRSEFLEMLRQQKIARDSVIGGSLENDAAMKRDQHGQELGQFHRLPQQFSDNDSTEREFWLLRNRLLRVQSQIRQKELEIDAMIKTGGSSPAQQRKISNAQIQLTDLHTEQRVVFNRLRDVQTKKR